MIKLSFLSDKIDILADSIGLPVGLLKLAICLFASFPFCAVLKRLPDNNKKLRCYYIISVSFFYIFGILNIYSGFQTLFISSLITYLCSRYLKSNLMPWTNFVLIMGHLMYSHIYAQFFIDPNADYNENVGVDITGAQMVLVMKLTAFAWNIQDGLILSNPVTAPNCDLTEIQKSKAIYKHPSILEYWAYCFFFPSLLTGPAFDYIDYENWLTNNLFSEIPADKRPGKKRKRMIPKSGRVSLWKAIQGVLWILLWFKLTTIFSNKYLFERSFLSKNFFYKIFYLWVLSFTYRLKYYGAWSIAEASCILCGIGFNGIKINADKSISFRWDKVQNIDPIGFETAQNVHIGLEAWNQNTNKWLKNYVYLRIKRKNRRAGFKSTLFTFLTSAMWHGTRPGYYLTFACGAFLQTCGRYYRRYFRPIFIESDGKTFKATKIYYDILCFLFTQLAFGYLVQPFVILDFNQSLYAWRTCYYYIHVIILGTFLVFRGPFAKSVVNFLKKYHNQGSKDKKQIYTSNMDELNKLSYILKQKEEFEKTEMALGVPTPDFDRKEVENVIEEVNEMKEELREWKKRASMDEQSEAIKEAVKSLKQEVGSFLPHDMHLSKKSE
ncbi:lysophospholipid acyltransferase [Ascoidea rubescens DSM 1968]|uniref:MBOAT-domain-containing protein n=1 Tax=Ascoidea rubescens DSM 1968 TaxID=1344418 RepID=A0A1D2VAG5_9ASCO|nr:MBOAT-domain-containing protein [Ascoidea rubescens DSM 1968]ODV58658.1 MBOAT-domain-containing protein [Ascoidea rubescens DSM 1968]